MMPLCISFGKGNQQLNHVVFYCEVQGRYLIFAQILSFHEEVRKRKNGFQH